MPDLPGAARPRRRAAGLAAGLACMAAPALAQSAGAQTPVTTLPPVVVEGETRLPPLTPATVPGNAVREQAPRALPGNLALVPADRFRDRPAVTTLQHAPEYVPGVFAATTWGEDSRLSIGGSGLARNVHPRGVRLARDGGPTNLAEGSGDFAAATPNAPLFEPGFDRAAFAGRPYRF